MEGVACGTAGDLSCCVGVEDAFTFQVDRSAERGRILAATGVSFGQASLAAWSAGERGAAAAEVVVVVVEEMPPLIEFLFEVRRER